MPTRSSGSLQDRREVPDAEPPASVVCCAGKSGNRSPLRQLSFLIAENSMRELGDSNAVSVRSRWTEWVPHPSWGGSGGQSQRIRAMRLERFRELDLHFVLRTHACIRGLSLDGTFLAHHEEAPARWRGLLQFEASGLGADAPRLVVFPNLRQSGANPMSGAG